MGRFIILSFLVMGWAFYELSGGADFVPETRVLAEAEAPQAEIVTRADTATLVSLTEEVASPVAATLTLPAALDFQATIGAAARTARLQALRDRWVGQLRDLPGIEVLTPDDPRMHGGMTSFRLSGRTSETRNKALAATLLDRFGIFTVHRTGLASGACVRATPALFNSMADVDALAAALKQIV